MIAMPLDEMERRARRLGGQPLRQAGVPASVVEGQSTVGGGSLPGEMLPTWLVALDAARAGARGGAGRPRSRPAGRPPAPPATRRWWPAWTAAGSCWTRAPWAPARSRRCWRPSARPARASGAHGRAGASGTWRALPARSAGASPGRSCGASLPWPQRRARVGTGRCPEPRSPIPLSPVPGSTPGIARRTRPPEVTRMKLGLVLVLNPTPRTAPLLYSGRLDEGLAAAAAPGLRRRGAEHPRPHRGRRRRAGNKLRGHGLGVCTLATGQAFGKHGLSLSSPDPEVRRRAMPTPAGPRPAWPRCWAAR